MTQLDLQVPWGENAWPACLGHQEHVEIAHVGDPKLTWG